GNRGPGPTWSRAPASALHGDHLDMVPEIGRSFRQRLHHTLHAARARPVVLREVQNAHGCCPSGGETGPSVYISVVGPATSPDIPTAVNLRIHCGEAL